MEEFFLFGSNFSSVKFHAHLVGYEGVYSGLIPQDKLLTGNFEGFVFPILFKHQQAHKDFDIIDTGTALYLISERFKKILEENKLTGWQCFPVTLLDKSENVIAGYHGFSVIGKCGRIDYKKCEIIEKRYVEYGPVIKEFKGLPIDLNKWDLTDFFLPDGYFGTIITNRTAEILTKNKITNLKLTRITDIETSESSLRILRLI